MDNRLLSEQEIELITRTAGSGYRAWTDIAKAQLAKTDEEWVEWLKTFIYNEYGTIIIQDNCWQSRRKEIGL